MTVPSIVVMVPGLYLYRGFYNLGIMSLSVSASWFAAALLIIASLPLGLIFARILTDKAFSVLYLTGAKSESRRANTPVYAPILKKNYFSNLQGGCYNGGDKNNSFLLIEKSGI